VAIPTGQPAWANPLMNFSIPVLVTSPMAKAFT
jgi:hypothetical protein